MTPGSPSGTTTTRRRTRNIQACNTCRERRTKCDGQRPQCSFCLERGKDCLYLGVPDVPPSPLELEISKVWEQLDQITAKLEDLQPPEVDRSPGDQEEYGNPGGGFDMIRGFPYMTLKNESFMALLGLKGLFARHIERTERSQSMHSVPPSPVVSIDHDDAWRQVGQLLNIFAQRVQIWYPVLHVEFTSEFMNSISNAFPPSPESCIALLVLAIAMTVEDSPHLCPANYSGAEDYLQAALEMLPTLLDGSHGTRETQCFLLLSIYYICRVKPSHAYDFLSMASYSVQSELQNGSDSVDEKSGIIANCYWIILLIESEISVQLDADDSGIWDMLSAAPPPSNLQTWGMSQAITSAATDGDSRLSNGLLPDDMSYFLSEIALRQMLQRCTWSVQEVHPGHFAYAPIVAAELERQLDEWRRLLPGRYRFRDDETETTSSSTAPQAAFLRTQFYAFKASVFWPAVYQTLTTDERDYAYLPDCIRFFEAYGAFIRGAACAVRVCRPNLWTLCTSVFTISMAALTGSTVPWLAFRITSTFIVDIQVALQILEEVHSLSPSLAEMGRLLRERTLESLSS
ncbi:hypothetical protein BJX70DRAFT_385320 [Aspergillus crustosus]